MSSARLRLRPVRRVLALVLTASLLGGASCEPGAPAPEGSTLDGQRIAAATRVPTGATALLSDRGRLAEELGTVASSWSQEPMPTGWTAGPAAWYELRKWELRRAYPDVYALEREDFGLDLAYDGSVDGSLPRDPGSLGWLFALPPLAVTVNDGLSGLTEEVIPALADEDLIELDPIYFLEDEDLTCATASAWLGGMDLLAPVKKRTIEGHFGNGGKVRTDVSLPDADFDATFTFDTDEVPNAGFGCWLAEAFLDISEALSPFRDYPDWPELHEEIVFDAYGLSGELDFTLAAEDGQLVLASLDQLELAVDGTDFESTPTIDSVTTLALAAGTFACQLGQDLVQAADLDWTYATGELVIDLDALGAAEEIETITDCLNALVASVVVPSKAEEIGEAIDTALDQSLSIEQSVPMTGFDADVVVELEALDSSFAADTMTAEFGFDVDSDAPTDPCATGLGWSAGLASEEAPSSWADFDLQVPHWVLAKGLYELGRQGLFCGTTLMPGSTAPWTVQPAGKLTVGDASFIQCTPTVCTIQRQGQLEIRVPMAFVGTGTGVTGSATGALVVYVEPSLVRRSLVLVTHDVDFENVVGSLQLPTGAVINASSLVSAVLNTAANAVAGALAPVPLLPKTTTLDDAFQLALATVLVNDTYTTLGIEIEEAPGFEPHPVDPGGTPAPGPGGVDPIDPLDPTWQDPLP